MEYLLLAFGGASGSLARFVIAKRISEKATKGIPLGTIIINITGALLLGIITSIEMSGNLYLLLADGFLGAYTTFSTFMYEGFNFFQDNEKMNAAVYIMATLILGVIGYMIGFGTVKFISLI